MIRDGGIFYGFFHGAKVKLSYAIDKYGILNEKKTFKGYHNTETLLENYKYFNLKDGKSGNGHIPTSWKRSFAHGRTIVKEKNAIEDFKSSLNE